MNTLLRISRAIDAINRRLGHVASWLVLLASLISAGNALSRYTISVSSNAWLEIQWYMFGAMVMLGASYTLNRNEHVRVDLIYGNVSERTRLWIDFLGGIVFLLPATTILFWLSIPIFTRSLMGWEMSGNAGGLLRWPIKFFLPFGFFMLSLQGLSEVIKRWAALAGWYTLTHGYEKPVQ